MHIAVIGTGYVGLVSGACFAEFGNDVTCVDSDAAKIGMLEAGRMPIYEPGLAELVAKNVRQNRLHFTTDIRSAVERSLVVMLAVGTPPKENGAADMSQIEAVALEIAHALNGYKVIVTKSTVPVGAAGYIRKIIEENKQSNCRFSVASNPEFLREGAAIDDFKRPDRIVIGCNDEEAVEILKDMYRPLYLISTPFVITSPESAEMIKYASNTFLAMKISFINEIANLCDLFGADVHDVARGMGMDNRIGSKFLHAGPGFGGSCFEGQETVFTLNSPTVATETLESVFVEAGKTFEGDTVQVALLEDKRVMAFDLETGQPTLANVKAVTRRPYKGTMVSFATSMGRTLSVTADHPVILRTSEGVGIVPAVAVAPGDQMLALCELPVVESARDFNLIERLRDAALANDVYVSSVDDTFAAQYSRFAAHIPDEMLRWPEEIKRGNRMSLSLFFYLSERCLLDADPRRLQLYTALGAAT
ncbi:MAG TPA: nucleotide sugar dehydrogenase, partial [Blastocatellia bacterium]